MKGLTTYCGEIWRCRYFWLSLVHVDLRARYRGSAVGIGWSLLQPIAMTAIICTVFATMFGQEIANFAPYLMAGLTYWQFVTSSALGGCMCFFAGEGYIRQHPAPMAIYPLRTMLGSAFHFLMGFLLVIGLSWICHGIGFIGVMPFLSLIPSFVLLLAFGWSLAILFGLATVRFRDIKHLAEVGFQGLFYLTTIMYPPEKVQDMLQRRTIGWVFSLNPLIPLLDVVRLPVAMGTVPSPSAYLAASLITLVTASAAMLALKSEERKVIFHL